MNAPGDAQPRRDVLAFGRYRFDRINRILSRDGEELPLPPRAAAVLSALLEDPGAVVSKQALIDRVWNGAAVSETVLSEAVRILRQAFEDDPQESKYIQTLHRRGYRFIAPIEEEVRPPEPAPGVAPEPPPRMRRPLRWLALAAAAAAAMVGAFVAGRGSAPAPARPVPTRFAVAPAPGQEIETWTPSLTTSADGRHLVYVVRRGGEMVLFHRDLAGFASREIAGTRGAMMPFFSADGRRVGFLGDRQLVAVPLSGGTPVPLAPIAGPFGGASWGANDTLIYAGGSPASLYRVRPGGAVEQLTRPDSARGEYEHRWPHLLPGGNEMLFTSWSTNVADARVEWLSLETGARRTVVRGAADARFAGGFLVCVRPDRTLVAARLDPARGQLTGTLLPMLRDGHLLENAGAAQVAIGGRTLAYLPLTEGKGRRSFQRLSEGRPQPLSIAPRFYQTFQPGPRQAIAAAVLEGGRADIWLVDGAAGTSSRFTFTGFNVQPVWSPDGEWVAFASKTDGPYNVHRRRANGSGAAELLVKSPRHQYPMTWSPDGRQLILYDPAAPDDVDLWVLDLTTRRLRPLLHTKARAVDAAWSPDGKWLAYSSDETGRWAVYVRSYPDGRGLWQVSPEGGVEASWSEDGSAIYFRRLHGRTQMELWVVPVRPAGGDLNPGPARRVYESAALVAGIAGPGGVTLLTAETKANASEVRVIRDWVSTVPAAR